MIRDTLAVPVGIPLGVTHLCLRRHGRAISRRLRAVQLERRQKPCSANTVEAHRLQVMPLAIRLAGSDRSAQLRGSATVATAYHSWEVRGAPKACVSANLRSCHAFE
jgi:hypothetical protein